MSLYGDDYIEISGILSGIDGNFYKICFNPQQKEIYVPCYLIQHRVSQNVDSPQTFLLPKWFLLKNRIIAISSY